MSMLLAAAIASIIGAIGATATSAISNKYNLEATKEANKTNVDLQQQANELQMEMAERANTFSAVEAQKNRDWQEYMSNTQYQRAMADMQAAGLNPILAGNAGASIGSGSAASGNMAGISAASVNAPKIDLSSISSAFNAMSNAVLISSIFGNKNSSSSDMKLKDGYYVWKDNGKTYKWKAL